MEFDEDYFKEKFEIDDEEDLQKIRYELGQSSKEKLVSQEILTWGNNNLCQLGYENKGAKLTAHPKTVDLPYDVSNCKDTIVDVTCSRKCSFFLT